MVLKVIDCQTGEVVDEINRGDRILRKRSTEYLTQTVEIRENEPYVKVFTKTIFKVAARLDGTTNQLINMLIPFISYETGVLQHSNGKPLNKQAIIDMTPLNEKTVEKCLNKLISFKILGKHKTGRRVCYTANPFIFMKGRRVSKTLYKFFESSDWAK